MTTMQKFDNPASTDASVSTGEFLTFRLAAEEYGIEIGHVREIIGCTPVTPIPQMPRSIRGVINLRGKVIPIVDLRSRFGMERIADTEKSCFIVVEVGRDAERVVVGIIVDEVSEVLDIRPDQIEPLPAFGAGVDVAFISGIGKVNEKVVMLLNVDRTLSVSEIERMYDASAAVGG